MRKKDFKNVSKYWKSAIYRHLPRLPWHDVGLRIEGATIIDISSHFIDYWNHCITEDIVVKQMQK